MVILNRKYIQAENWCKKLEEKLFGHFGMQSRRRNSCYCKVKLPDAWNIHLAGNIHLFNYDSGDDRQKYRVEFEVDGNGWAMQSLIKSGPSVDNPKQHGFLVTWTEQR